MLLSVCVVYCIGCLLFEGLICVCVFVRFVCLFFECLICLLCFCFVFFWVVVFRMFDVRLCDRVLLCLLSGCFVTCLLVAFACVVCLCYCFVL